MCKVQIKTKATEKKYCSYILNYDKMCNFAMQNTSLTERIIFLLNTFILFSNFSFRQFYNPSSGQNDTDGRYNDKKNINHINTR